MNKYYLSIIFILEFVVNICSSKLQINDVLAGKDTLVWFIESNSKDPESPYLRKIPDALVKAGLISENIDESSGTSFSNVGSTSHDKNDKKTDSLYLEILVVVDYGLYKKLGENVDDALKYVISFWNGVDLRYKLITSPTIYVNVAGIILAKDPNALYYVQQSKNNRGHIIANKVLFEGGKYFLYEKQFKKYDIAVTMTTENICSVSSTNICYSDIVGLSLLGKACHTHLNTAIIEDNGGFSGTIPATHEIAHLLNVPHDGTGEAASCSTGDGYIMTPSASIGENNLKWSPCSKNILKKYSLTSTVSCLKNKPTPGSPVTRILPGKLLSVNEQCARAGYGIPCFNGKRVCHTLSCFRMDYKICDADGPSAEGSFCGENMYCRNGECVPEN